MRTNASTDFADFPATTPADDACANAETSGTPFDTAYASTLRTVASPIPRAGTFTIRRSDTSSRGFAATRR